ncbi:hypothetical protein Pelo_11788 [Pelomyxa schiedti]|nr:hypothetical protein Pelo_11788 [Pelomyxa schiedti]
MAANHAVGDGSAAARNYGSPTPTTPTKAMMGSFPVVNNTVSTSPIRVGGSSQAASLSTPLRPGLRRPPRSTSVGDLGARRRDYDLSSAAAAEQHIDGSASVDLYGGESVDLDDDDDDDAAVGADDFSERPSDAVALGEHERREWMRRRCRNQQLRESDAAGGAHPSGPRASSRSLSASGESGTAAAARMLFGCVEDHSMFSRWEGYAWFLSRMELAEGFESDERRPGL